MNEISAAVAEAGVAALGRVDAALAEFPDDARLLFLRGSLLVELDRNGEAHDALVKAVAAAPDFALARFQLGFFQLTSGEADAALETWGRLDRLPDGHYLRRFVDGLRALIRDDFAGAIAAIEDGMGLNIDNPALNANMAMLADQCRKELSGTGEPPATSEAEFLLRQSRGRHNSH
ncbi:MAG: hypothetical protein IV086_06395 [Hyphomonadaceae bacterium]|nr:hypothetical protein [Hyphomonadaceae bacterium]